MQALDPKEKEHVIIKFATAVNKVLKRSSYSSGSNFAVEAGMERAHVQRVLAGKKNAELTTIEALARGFGISVTKLMSFYDGISDQEIKDYRHQLEEQRQQKGRKKKPS